MLMLAGVWMSARSAAGGDFRVENEIFVGSRKEPISSSTTIFLDGAVYDYLEDPTEVIVLEKDLRRFTLLDAARRLRTEVPTSKVEAFTKQMQQSAGAHKDPFLRFLAAPKFHVQFDENSGELTLSSAWMTYRLELVVAESAEISRQYRESCDWYARINAVLNPGSRPPLARLMVNAAMAEHEATARQVHLTMTPKKTFPPTRVEVRSEHQLVYQIVQADLDRVAQTRQFMQIYKPVGFEQFRHAPDR